MYPRLRMFFYLQVLVEVHVCNTEKIFLNITHGIENLMVYFDYRGSSQYAIFNWRTSDRNFFSLPKSVSEMLTTERVLNIMTHTITRGKAF